MHANQEGSGKPAEAGKQSCTTAQSSGILARSEYMLGKTSALAVSCVLKSCSFARTYPRLSCTIVALVPWMVPGARRRMLRSCSGLMRYAVCSLGEYIRDRMSLWLVGSLPERLDNTEQTLEKVVVSLEEIRELQDEHSKQLLDILQQLESLESEVSQGNMDILARMDILEQRYNALSGEQKKILIEYGLQFGTRLDQLAEGMSLLLRQTGTTQGASCSRQARLKLS